MPRYDYRAAAHGIARLAFAALLALVTIVLTDLTATATHWAIALPIFASGVLGVIFVADTDERI